MPSSEPRCNAGIYLSVSRMEENSVHHSIESSKLNKSQSPPAVPDVAVPVPIAVYNGSVSCACW